MAHILETINKDKIFTASQIVEQQITNLMARMYDATMLFDDQDEIEVIESWRTELTIIRNAIYDLTK